MDLLLGFVFSGIVTGALYALVAVGFGLIFSTTGVFHIAHASVIAVAAYACIWVSSLGASSPWILWPVGIVAGTILGALIFQLVYLRLLQRAGIGLTSFIAALGVTIIVTSAITLIFGGTPQRIPGEGLLTKFTVGPVKVSLLDLITLVLASVAIGLSILLTDRTRSGLKIRAVAGDVSLSRAYGLPIAKTMLITVLVGSALAALAGVIFGTRSYATPSAGLDLVLLGSIAVFLGGVGNTLGTAVAAVLIGVFERVSLLMVPGTWNYALTFGLFFILVLIKPGGFLRFKPSRDEPGPKIVDEVLLPEATRP